MNNFASRKFAVLEKNGEKEVVVRTYIENGVEKREVEATPTAKEAWKQLKAQIEGQKETVSEEKEEKKVRYKKNVLIEKIPYTYHIIYDTTTKKVIAKVTNLELLASASDNDLLIVYGSDDEENKDKKNFTHIRLNLGKPEIQTFEGLSSVEFSNNQKIWVLNSEVNGPAIYNVKTKETLYAKQLAPSYATDFAFNVSGEDAIVLDYTVLVGKFMDTISTVIDCDNFNTLQTFSTNRLGAIDCPNRNASYKVNVDTDSNSKVYTGLGEGEEYRKHIYNQYVQLLEKENAFYEVLNKMSSLDQKTTIENFRFVCDALRKETEEKEHIERELLEQELLNYGEDIPELSLTKKSE